MKTKQRTTTQRRQSGALPDDMTRGRQGYKPQGGRRRERQRRLVLNIGAADRRTECSISETHQVDSIFRLLVAK